MRLCFVFALSAAVPGVLAAQPRTCATYFDFRKTLHSDYHFGLVNSDGSITERANLGRLFDPEVSCMQGDEAQQPNQPP